MIVPPASLSRLYPPLGARPGPPVGCPPPRGHRAWPGQRRGSMSPWTPVAHGTPVCNPVAHGTAMPGDSISRTSGALPLPRFSGPPLGLPGPFSFPDTGDSTTATTPRVLVDLVLVAISPGKSGSALGRGTSRTLEAPFSRPRSAAYRGLPRPRPGRPRGGDTVARGSRSIICS